MFDLKIAFVYPLLLEVEFKSSYILSKQMQRHFTSSYCTKKYYAISEWVMGLVANRVVKTLSNLLPRIKIDYNYTRIIAY